MFTMNTVTLVTAKKRKRQYMRAYARAWEKVIMKIFTISFCSFFFAQLKQHFVLWKTTRRLMQNHTSFYEKPYVVLWKTTRRFSKTSTQLRWLSKCTIYARYVRGHSLWWMNHSKTSSMRCKNKNLHLLVESADDNTVISFVKSKFLMYICG